MFDISNVIGLEKAKAVELLNKNGFENIKLIENSVHNDLCDTKLVCSAKQTGDVVTLVCGEFYLDIKE